MRCRLCGFDFDPSGMACHTSCPMGSRCSLICCPNCGYQVVDESKSGLARVLKRRWRARAGREDDQPLDDGTIPLTHVPTGAGAEVDGLAEMPPARASRLTAFGLTPGTHVEVVQRKPVPVVKIGETELALSEDILRQVRVRV